jgi:hypothetical protein
MESLKIYLVRHAESCSNIARNDLSTLHDKVEAYPVVQTLLNQVQKDKLNYPGFLNEADTPLSSNAGLFKTEKMKQLRDVNDDSGEYTSFRYHPSITQNGIDQVLKLKEKMNKNLESNEATAEKTAAFDIMENAGTVFISSGTLRTVMTALLLIRDRVLKHLENQKPGPLIRIFPHLNEAISSKVKGYTDKKKIKDEDVEKFIKAQVKADFAIPHEIIKDVIRAGITWLVQHNYYKSDSKLDLVNDILGVIDFEYYITYCKKTIIEQTNTINPYLQDMNLFKKCLYDEYLENKLANTFVLFVHFKVIFNELNIKGKLDKKFDVSQQSDRGDNASIWLENAVIDDEKKGFQLTDITLIDEGPKVRKYKKDFIDTEDESICYVNFTDSQTPTIDNLTYTINRIYDSMLPGNSTTKVTFSSPTKVTKGGHRISRGKKRVSRKKRVRSVNRKSRKRRNSRKT